MDFSPVIFEREEIFKGDAVSVAAAIAREQSEINQRHLENGALIVDPRSTFIGEAVCIAAGAVIMPGCVLEGETEIGEGAVVGPYSSLKNTKIGKASRVRYSVAVDSVVGEDTEVGPFAYIRPNSKIGSRVKVGDFVEVKNSSVGDGTKISHLTYVGDSDVGERVNFGCGTVTVNYDGVAKERTVIRDDAFIGCNANLVAPVVVGEGAYIAAGSTITDDVPDGMFAIARERQTVKKGGRHVAKH